MWYIRTLIYIYIYLKYNYKVIYIYMPQHVWRFHPNVFSTFFLVLAILGPTRHRLAFMCEQSLVRHRNRLPKTPKPMWRFVSSVGVWCGGCFCTIIRRTHQNTRRQGTGFTRFGHRTGAEWVETCQICLTNVMFRKKCQNVGAWSDTHPEATTFS